MSNILVLGGTGFIGTSLVEYLSADESNSVVVAAMGLTSQHVDSERLRYVEFDFCNDSYEGLLDKVDFVYHLISTTTPVTSMKDIPSGITRNVSSTARLLDACVRYTPSCRIVFLSSGGTVYGNDTVAPIPEDSPLNPINAYGYQKVAIEQLLAFYFAAFGLDYRIVRLSNPYGPNQDPRFGLGVVSTFIHKALNNEPLDLYGDGTVVRDLIYIDDAVRGIVNIANSSTKSKIFNLGSGEGVSVREIAEKVVQLVNEKCEINYLPGRAVDASVNYLDMTRYRCEISEDPCLSLEEGIILTKECLMKKRF